MSANLRSPRARRRAADPMAEHDALPAEARRWVTAAALPWSARSVRRLWLAALAETGSPEVARARLDAAERATLAREAPRVWGRGHPGPAAAISRGAS